MGATTLETCRVALQ